MAWTSNKARGNAPGSFLHFFKVLILRNLDVLCVALLVFNYFTSALVRM